MRILNQETSWQTNTILHSSRILKALSMTGPCDLFLQNPFYDTRSMQNEAIGLPVHREPQRTAAMVCRSPRIAEMAIHVHPKAIHLCPRWSEYLSFCPFYLWLRNGDLTQVWSVKTCDDIQIWTSMFSGIPESATFHLNHNSITKAKCFSKIQFHYNTEKID